MQHIECLIIGAGFGGIGMAIQLKKSGKSDFQIWEKASDFGGCWRDNTYPGAACDVPSHLYSYSFAPKKNWQYRFARQPEILSYIQQCAQQYQLISHLRFDHGVRSAAFDKQQQLWVIEAENGNKITTRYLMTATGQLNRPLIPSISGLDTFKGEHFHSAQWRHDIDLTGKTVAVIGTGASAIQFVPEITKIAAQVTLFQRSAPYVLPKPDRAYKPWEHTLLKWVPGLQKLSRVKTYLQYESRVLGFRFHEHLMKIMAGQWARYMKSQIKDPELRSALTPNYPMGCKRILLANNYYETMKRENVSLCSHGIKSVNDSGIIDNNGQHHPVDVIIYATGFKATEFLVPITITGTNGESLHDVWKNGAEAYFGINVQGFPNLFMLYGPNTNLGHNSIIYMLESQFRYILSAIKYQEKGGFRSIDVLTAPQRVFNENIQAKIKNTVWNQGCHSWYITDEGKNTVNWPTFTFNYRRMTRKFHSADYHSQR
ncbi:NAD(P)/FAD-dependent oxidoreductase [Thalassolituus sp.]|uniref:flavin-containing monooxygenase n=1 Tax=Thalassolituus sp. TaxID=2030822 RepID=UPI002A835632|nr:NAD(P)/FAD-dependent oxidoreductase [Thalassolituus sp.]|tara:strand:- start:2652 stop:4106 length:1455 start_codon:yes stop_codon:yes gene_type:complete